MNNKNKEKQTLTTVYVPSEIYLEFKKLCLTTKDNFRKLVTFSLNKYNTDVDFRKEVNLYNVYYANSGSATVI